ncbi:MAG: lactate racemase domain-containing protein [Planctomyces sp.]
MKSIESAVLSSGGMTVQVSGRFLLPCPVQSSGASVAELCDAALREPLGYPELSRCVFPGDTVAVVPDPETPALAELLTVVLQQLQQAAEGTASILLVLSPDPAGRQWAWLLEKLPEVLLQRVQVHHHDPADKNQSGYVASSEGGERLYLNRQVSEADTIVTVGVVCFDGELGLRGTSSALFPGLSDNETQQRTGFVPGRLADVSPQLRRGLIDELGWLTGTQFAVQAVPGAGGVLQVLAGSPEQVLERGRLLCEEVWELEPEAPAEVVLSAVDGGPCGWLALGRALENLSEVVEQGGRVILVSDVELPEGPAMQMLRRTQDPENLVRPLQREPLEDSRQAVAVIEACRRARVYLLSRLPAEVVEELGMIPLGSDAELQKLLGTVENVWLLSGAQYLRCVV